MPLSIVCREWQDPLHALLRRTNKVCKLLRHVPGKVPAIIQPDLIQKVDITTVCVPSRALSTQEPVLLGAS